MAGYIATFFVVMQMALMANNIPVVNIMMVGLVGCFFWLIHAIKVKDKPLLITNIVVAGFAIYGIS